MNSLEISNEIDQLIRMMKAKGYSAEYALAFVVAITYSMLNDEQAQEVFKIVNEHDDKK